MRNMIRIILRRYKYPPDKQLEAIKLVMQQAEVLSDEWTNEPKKLYVANNHNSDMLMVAEKSPKYFKK